MPFEDLLFTPGQDNLAGLAGEAYFCPSADIATLPALTAAASLITAAANITCIATKKFQRIYFTDETGKLEVKSVGERDGKAREAVFTCKFPGDDAAVANAISDWQNTPGVLIIKDAKTGEFKLLGVTRLNKASTVLSKDIPAYFETGDASSGEKRPDSRGVMLSWKFTCAHDPITYKGTVPLVAA